MAIVPGLVSATPTPSSRATLAPRRAGSIQPGELIIDTFARLQQPSKHGLNGTVTSTAASACALSPTFNASASDPTSPLAYINPALIHDGQGNSSSSANSTSLCGASIIVINPFLSKAIAATFGGGCGNCSMYDIELSEAAWRELTGTGTGTGAVSGGGGEEGGPRLEGLKPGSVWKDGRENIGISVTWMISPVSSASSGQRPSLDMGQKRSVNTTQALNTINKARIPVSPGMAQVRVWRSM
ncbi:hypothetical protein GX51_04210 [Blastomyces parvus]|uniref:Uncharacterized protein n=1 Tax=Blastomyces parvus TaxID=2060905 RepID=A0A2B7X2M0_9EURO|nr:hypothetical protein GX51_04210 [Blastomyces parvus]